MLEKETLQKVLRNAADSLDTGNSNYTQQELDQILDTINKITNTQNKLSKYQAATFLHKSTSTFDNWVRDGKIPEGRKEAGFKEKFWLKSDLLNVDDEG